MIIPSTLKDVQNPKKRAEGKHYYVYIVADANKFLRIYYARVTKYLGELENKA